MAEADFDVAIVGGGPAGAATALELVRRRGVPPGRVVVIDKARFPRDKPCAGAVSQLGVDELAALGVTLRVPLVPMRGVRILLDGGAAETAAPMGIVARRTELDAQLLDEVRGDGVDVRDGVGLRAIARVGDGFALTTDAGAITAKLVAACDGAGSTTRKLLAVREPERKGHLYVLDTVSGAADEAVLRGLVDFDLGVVDEGLQGYYWDFPTPIGGAVQVSRGIYHANLTPRSDVKAVLGRFLARRGVDLATVKLRPFSTRPFVERSTTWLPGLVLVGEAAGIDRTTGEGIAQAIALGRIAGGHLAAAIEASAPASFAAYDRDVRRSVVGRHMLQSAWLARRAYGRLGAPARRYLLRSSYARAAAVRWYLGRPLSWATQLRLGLGIAASVV